jgi:hypothetical protein
VVNLLADIAIAVSHHKRFQQCLPDGQQIGEHLAFHFIDPL